jgi:preprotein translocase subunit SecE
MAEAAKLREEQLVHRGPAAVTAGVSRSWQRAVQFLRETRNQLRMVTWPSWREVYTTTLVVAVTVGFFALFFWITDTALGYGVQWLLKHYRH